MYSASDVVDGIKNPYKLIREMNVLYHTRFHHHNYNPGGIDIFEKDWDNLILLDACRYDTFKKTSDLPGSLTKVQSRGTHSKEFVKANFSNRELHDTVVVSANSYYKKLAKEHNIDLHDVFILLNEEAELSEKWPDMYEAYGNRIDPPELVSRKAIEVAEEYPNKRLIVHYMQPHRPFIGPNGIEKFSHVPEPMTDSIKSGEYDVTRQDVREAYKENLELVLDDVDKLMRELEGKTVVSGDHGELLGEGQSPLPLTTYGHVHGVYTPELTEVPWLEYDEGTRKNIVSEEPSEATEVTEKEMDKIDERLEKLGYKV